jgi:hypothetical protein
LAFVLFFLFGHIFGDPESGEGFRTFRDIIVFACFPVAAVIGLSVAYFRPFWGGLIATTGFAVFATIDPSAFSLENPYFLLMTVPGVIYIIHHFVSKKG